MQLKKLRTQQKLSQQALAKHLGVSRSTVAMWETGASQPDIEMLKRLADYFSCTVDTLVQDADTDIFDQALLTSRDTTQAIIMGYGKNGGQIVKKLTQEQFDKMMKILDVIDGKN